MWQPTLETPTMSSRLVSWGLGRSSCNSRLRSEANGPCHNYGSVDGMRTTIDKAGRLVIPRVLRDRIGLTGGGEVELELDGAGVRIDPVSTGELVEEDGFLFIPATGKRLTDDMVRELIDADRHRR